MPTIYDFVKEQRDNYRSQTIEITDGYEFSQYQTLRTIELYHNSKFTTGSKDSLGREKPFYNIVKFRVNVATRATDLDTKNVKIVSDTPGAQTEAFLLQLKNRNWMKANAFAVFLNRMGHTRAKYGGVLAKKVERDGELEIHIPQWRNMITDQVDIANGVKIERHYYTPSDLMTKVPKNWANIKEAIAASKKAQEAVAGNSPSKKNDTPGGYIEVFEVHGVLPTSYLAGTSDKYSDNYGSEDEYERICAILVLDESDKDKTTGVTLYAGIEDEDPYKYLAYEEIEGRGLGVGVVEDLFEAQVWTNYSVKQKKDLLDLAGKIVWQTSDQSIAARNILTDIENGTILVTAPNMPITQVSNVPTGLGGLAQLMSDWNEQAENSTSTYPSVLGQSPTAGTAFRLQATLVNQATSMFDYRRQEGGLFVQEIYRDWVLPFIVREIKKDKTLIADLTPDELQMVSDAIAKHEAVAFAKEKILSGDIPDPQSMIDVQRSAKSAIIERGNRHAFDGFDGLYDDWQGSTDVDSVGEQRDRQAALSALFELFGSVAANPQLLENPTMAKLFNEIVETAGMSPTLQQTGQSQPGPLPQPTDTGSQQVPEPTMNTPTIPNVPTT